MSHRVAVPCTFILLLLYVAAKTFAYFYMVYITSYIPGIWNTLLQDGVGRCSAVVCWYVGM